MNVSVNSHVGKFIAKDSNCLYTDIYTNYFTMIQKNIYKLVKDQEVTNDLTSEVLLKAMLNIHTFQDRGNTFAAWLHTIARNEVFQYFRTSKKEQELKLNLNSFTITETSLFDTLNEEKLLFSLKYLNKNELQIIEWRYFETLSFKEIAGFLNISENNAKVKCFRIIRKLRKKFNAL